MLINVRRIIRLTKKKTSQKKRNLKFIILFPKHKFNSDRNHKLKKDLPFIIVIIREILFEYLIISRNFSEILNENSKIYFIPFPLQFEFVLHCNYLNIIIFYCQPQQFYKYLINKDDFIMDHLEKQESSKALLTQLPEYSQLSQLQNLIIRANQNDEESQNLLGSKYLIQKGNNHYQNGKHDIALKYYQKVLKKKIAGITHWQYLYVCFKAGNINKKIKNLDKALKCYFVLLNISQLVTKQIKIQKLNALARDRVGMILCQQGEHKKALLYFFQALKIKKNTFSKNHRQFSFSLHNIAYTYYKLGSYQNSLEYYQKSLNIKQKFSGQDSLDQCSTLYGMATTYYKKKEYENGLKYFQMVKQIYQNHKKKDPNVEVEKFQSCSEYVLTFIGIGCIYNSIKDYDKSLECFKKALQLNEEILRKNSNIQANIENNIKIVLQNQKNNLQFRHLEIEKNLQEQTIFQSDKMEAKIFGSNKASEKYILKQMLQNDWIKKETSSPIAQDLENTYKIDIQSNDQYKQQILSKPSVDRQKNQRKDQPQKQICSKPFAENAEKEKEIGINRILNQKQEGEIQIQIANIKVYMTEQKKSKTEDLIDTPLSDLHHIE